MLIVMSIVNDSIPAESGMTVFSLKSDTRNNGVRSGICHAVYMYPGVEGQDNGTDAASLHIADEND